MLAGRVLFIGRVGQGDGLGDLRDELIGVTVRVGTAVDGEAAVVIALDLDKLGFDIDIRVGIVGEYEVVAVVGNGRVQSLLHIAGGDGVRRALIDGQTRVDHGVIQRRGHLTDTAARTQNIVAVGDFQRLLIAVGNGALARDLIEGNGLAGFDDKVVELLRAKADILCARLGIFAGLADGGFVRTELDDLRFQLSAGDGRLNGRRGQIDDAAFQRIDHRADLFIQSGDIQRLPRHVVRIGERGPLALVRNTRGADGGLIDFGFDLVEDLVDLAEVVGQRRVAHGGLFLKGFDLLIARGGRTGMPDRPELVELVGNVVLHIQAVAGDIPAAPVLGAQGDAERGNERLHLLGDDRRRLVERLALKRNIVDEDIRIEYAVSAVKRLLDIDEPTARTHADDQQHDGDNGAE